MKYQNIVIWRAFCQKPTLFSTDRTSTRQFIPATRYPSSDERVHHLMRRDNVPSLPLAPPCTRARTPCRASQQSAIAATSTPRQHQWNPSDASTTAKLAPPLHHHVLHCILLHILWTKTCFSFWSPGNQRLVHGKMQFLA
jgi:hypothetical protein